MINVGVVGCGRISNQYLTNLTTNFPATVKIASCADLNLDAANAVATEFGGAKAVAPDELYADPDVDVVLNLTNPWAHHAVNVAALRAGKHVYAEKPLGMTRDEALDMMAVAEKSGLRIGCAPDTFLGAGLQTCRKLIDEGWIGKPTAAYSRITMVGARMAGRYQSRQIGGVLLDMGPYYITALIALLGPARRVAGASVAASSSRTVTDMKAGDFGGVVDIETPVTVAGTLEFDDGVVGQVLTTTGGHSYGPFVEIIGTEGVLQVPDPNMFGGPVVIRRAGGESAHIPLTHQYDDRNRGLGLVEMMYAVEQNRPHRASAKLAYHVLDIMLSLVESSESGTYRTLERVCERPEPFVPGHFASPLL